METFTEATLLRRRRAGTSNRARSKLERTRRTRTATPYLFRSRIRRDLRNRKMQGESVRGSLYYRCRAATLAPGSPALQHHPRTVNLREDDLVEPIDTWLATLFDPEHLDTLAVQIDVSPQPWRQHDHVWRRGELGGEYALGLYGANAIE
ncbi:hypothetical protein [Nocardia sp. AG03]|uniref:hypothetical protein n=1 Tax=Nocardia sp. AG03 TaxID=3025312 RepID=UPI002418927D|nr:hypothetical protein [Nocardia sp. AG03]